MNTKKLRIPLDILMTLVSMILMGGAYLFPADIVHEILGVALFVLWAVHIALNRRWYGVLFRGQYNARRVLQTVINCGILGCVIFLMISGIILSNHIFAFLGIESGLGFARTAHLLASHWYYMFMSLHIGMHVEMIISKCHSRAPTREAVQEEIVSQSSPSFAKQNLRSSPAMFTKQTRSTVTNKSGSPMTWICRSIFILISLYGIYAFIIRGIWRYLVLQQQFFFLDLERGYVLFALDYISIIILFAITIHYLNKLLQKGKVS